MRRDGFAWTDNSVKTAFTAVLWLHNDPERLSILREVQDRIQRRARAGSSLEGIRRGVPRL